LAFHTLMEQRMRRVAIALVLPCLIPFALQSAFAAPLAPGKPAGVKQAQDQDTTPPLLVMGAAAIGIGIALAVSDNGNDGGAGTPPPTTTTTTTTGTGA
jgi:hypothetical protein